MTKGMQTVSRLPARPGSAAEPTHDHGAAPPIVHEVLRSPGQPLDPATRDYFEPRLGHDFSKVRVHTDSRAAGSAAAVDAAAYTAGRDIAFGAGRFSPRTETGRSLLAHELTHVVQQSASLHPAEAPLPIALKSDEAEHAAQRNAAGLRHRGTVSGPRTRGTLLQRARPGDVKSPDTRDSKSLSIQAGDVVVRNGTILGKSPLTKIIDEKYNHGGVAIDSSHIHHVEGKGYETVSVETFFAPENANGGAVIRFQGPFAERIRERVASIASAGRYKKIPGNPFSSAENLKTVNCNEFTHELFRQAIAEVMADAQKSDQAAFLQMAAEYTPLASQGKVKKLIAPKTVELAPGTDVIGTGAIVGIAEMVGNASIDDKAKKRGEVDVEFEGEIQRRNIYPKEWAESWNPFKSSAYWDGFYAVAVLKTYTPDSFVNSRYFTLVQTLQGAK